MKMQDQQQVVLLVQEALGEKMAKNMQKKVCQTIGWEMDQSKLFQWDSSTEDPKKKYLKNKVGKERVFER